MRPSLDMANDGSPPKRAIVIGAGMAGLCSARVLSDVFDEVIIVERDRLPQEPAHRPGVPQDRHAHVLMGRGARELERLFPGFAREMRERGACDIDWQMDIATLKPTGWLLRNGLRRRLGLTLIMATRLLIESVVRARVRALANVRFLEQTTVTGLALAAGGPRRVTGIRCSSKRGGDTTLAGALAVDASGRGSKAPAWLRALGLEPPEEIVVDSLIGYASRWYEAPPPGRWPQNWWWKGIWVDPVPPAIQKGGALFPVEDGQLLLTVAGLGPDVPPADEASLEAFLRGFRTTVLADAVALAKPISKVFSYRQMPNRWRRFERWSERLAGFVVIGDSACAFNPIYAQGMSVAACVAGILADCCRRSGPLSPQLPSAFAKAQAKFLSGPWALATGADFSYSTTAGRPPLANKLLAPYLDAFFETAFDDPTLSILFEEVSQMLRPATAMMHPSVVARVLMRRLNPFVRRRPRDPAVLPPAALVFHDLPPRWLERHAGAAVAPSFSES